MNQIFIAKGDMFMKKNLQCEICSKNCISCKRLNIKTDDKGYPWGYECMKYGDSVFQKEFTSTKSFNR